MLVKNARLPGIYAALIAAGAIAVASAAQAFTIENGSAGGGSNLMAPSPFNDPTKKPTDSTSTNSNGTTSMQFGGGTLTYGTRGSVERDFNSGVDRMFNPLGRPPEH